MYILNNYNKLYNNNNILKIYYYIKNYNFIIFLNNNQFNNKNLLNLKMELFKFNNKCFIINTKYVKNIFDYKSFGFLSTNIIVVIFKEFKDFLLMEKFFYDKKFYFSYKKNFGIMKKLNNIFNFENNSFLLGFIIFKFILYIIILLLYIIYIIIKLLIN